MGHKSVYDVNTVADVWSWISMGLVPLLWVEAWDVSEPRTNAIMRCYSPPENLAMFDEGWAGATAGNGTGRLKTFQQCAENEELLPALPKEYLGPEPKGMYLYYNRIIGGVRLRQERRDQTSCPSDGYLANPAFAAPCLP